MDAIDIVLYALLYLVGYLTCHYLQKYRDEKGPERREELLKLARLFYERNGTSSGYGFNYKAVTHEECKIHLHYELGVRLRLASEIAIIALSDHLNSNPIIPPFSPSDKRSVRN